MRGEQLVQGQRYAGVMPAWRDVLTAPEMAGVLSYIRQAWGNHAPPITASYVHKISEKYESRHGFWSWSELEAIHPDSEAQPASY